MSGGHFNYKQYCLDDDSFKSRLKKRFRKT